MIERFISSTSSATVALGFSALCSGSDFSDLELSTFVDVSTIPEYSSLVSELLLLFRVRFPNESSTRIIF